jgi:hypothetical protein
MKKLNILGFAVVAMLLSANAWAGFAQTFVSGTGINTNTSCSVGAPCASIQVALGLTNPGGQVIVEGSGAFAGFTVSKSVTIEAAPGVYAGLSASGNVITIGAGGSDVVVLRGLTIESGTGGIVYNTGAELHVENCVINGLRQDGIDSNGSGGLFVKDTVIRNGDGDGIDIGGGGVASLDRIKLENNSNGWGLDVASGKASITNSVASGNYNGIEADGLSASAEINVESCLVANNGYAGIVSNGSYGTTTVRVSNSTVTDNADYGLIAVSGTLLSRVNNTVEGNGTNTSGTTTYTAM